MIKNYDNLLAIVKMDIKECKINKCALRVLEQPGLRSSEDMQYLNGMIKALEDVIKYINSDRIR